MIDVGRPVLVLQHDVAAGPGLVEEWIALRGGTTQRLSVPDADELPPPDGYALVVALGSAHCAADDHGWIASEIELLAEAHRMGIPLLGICFGGQLLARTLGAEVRVSSAREIGWTAVESRDSRVSEGPWFQWHHDTFTLPPGAELLADSGAGVEAFAAGRSVGVQFHPEVTREIVRSWTDVYRSDLAKSSIEARALLEGAPPSKTLRARAFELFDGLTRDGDSS